MNNTLHLASKEINISIKVRELIFELKENNLWQKHLPEWVNHFDHKAGPGEIDFAQWLQFIFIPNYLNYNGSGIEVNKISLVPQALRYFENDIKRGKLLQIIIEIDSII